MPNWATALTDRQNHKVAVGLIEELQDSVAKLLLPLVSVRPGAEDKLVK